MTDLDPQMVAAARRRVGGHRRFTAIQADVTALPFTDGSFDFVTSHLMLHHVIEWHDALAEAARVLRPGGTLLGYDLARTRVAAWVHRADRSAHRLIGLDEWAPGLHSAGFDSIRLDRGLSNHLVRFHARTP